MMAKVKDVFGVVGQNAACYARDLGGYARNFGGKAKDAGVELGHKTSALAHRVGPKRGAIALGIIGAAIAIPFIVRYVRNRRAMREEEMLDESGEARAPRPRRTAAAAPTATA